MPRGFVAFALCIVAFHNASNAQIIFEPVRYQYGPNLFYGGNDRRVLDYAAQLRCIYGGSRAYDFDGNEITTLRRGITTRTTMVFTDCAPYLNATLYGFTPNDAHNEANASVPRYFRKSDLLRAVELTRDGNRVVPAGAIPVAPIPESLRRPTTTRPATKPAAILILPWKGRARVAAMTSDNEPSKGK